VSVRVGRKEEEKESNSSYSTFLMTAAHENFQDICWDMGQGPVGTFFSAAWIRNAGHETTKTIDLLRTNDDYFLGVLHSILSV